MIYEFPDIESSLISSISYDDEQRELTVNFRKYYTEQLTYCGVSWNTVNTLVDANSIGSCYLSLIKTCFKLKNKYMQTDKKVPTGINKSSSKKRFIKIRIDTTKIEKKWITFGEKGSYLDVTLQMLPDGEVDRYQNLGMITQDVPASIYKEDKTIKGAILGNGRELDWNGGSSESIPGSSVNEVSGDVDDLPF